MRGQYQNRQRSLKDIAAETGIPVEALAAAARQAGIRARRGINGRAHPLAIFGGPGGFPPDVWSTFTYPGAEQRTRRLLALPDSPASTTQPASSASGAPSSPARSASSRPPSAPPSCAPDQTDYSH
jgi:hypothetical protein